MKHLFLLILAFVLFACTSFSQEEEQYPAEFEYLDLDQEAVAENLPEILHAIASPAGVLKSKQELRVHCRVLVDEQGRYIRHLFTRVDDPRLMGPISVQIPNMRFAPALKDNEWVASWVNVPLIFSPDMKPIPSRRMVLQQRRMAIFRGQIDEEDLLMEIQLMADRQHWPELLGTATQALGRHRTQLSRKNPAALAELYHQRASALLWLGYEEQALQDLNEALVLTPASDEYSELEARLRALRCLVWMMNGQPERLIAEFAWFQQDWQTSLAKETWTQLLHSQELRADLTMAPLAWLGEQMPLPFRSLCLGLAWQEQQEFGKAIPFLQAELANVGRGPWQRDLSLRLAECHRQQGQYEAALNLVQVVLEAAPLDPIPHFMKGLVFLDLQNDTLATDAFRKALALGIEGHARSFAIVQLGQQQASILAEGTW